MRMIGQNHSATIFLTLSINDGSLLTTNHD